jgi:hypothetical protein
MAFENTADDMWLVRLDTRCRAFRAALASEDILLEILLREFKPGRHTIKGDAYQFTVRFPENRDSEFSTICIHI